jgi:hypothetical protein
MDKEIWKECLHEIAYRIDDEIAKKNIFLDHRFMRISMGYIVYFEGRDFTSSFEL